MVVYTKLGIVPKIYIDGLEFFRNPKNKYPGKILIIILLKVN